MSNNLLLFSYRNKILKKLTTFESHPKRILYLSKSKCNKYVISASSDGILKLWSLNKFYYKDRNSVLDLSSNNLR